ncbi:putative mediator of RNA polymerase II transcription subunit 29 [Episyrphus balteatus]|uniref:putative mediator of RNA polymerase II transcription subunit 29 n=1 Tax=Episyrphus balteatus TaxID=286459 RepID=UPI002485AAB5|nr:putative mediator of RNA polymerase II transcription subunit 29 [Episyrphus balteatus]
MAKLQMFSLITICLIFCIGTINSAVTAGYFYENPIRPFNPASFPPLRSTGQYSGIPFGQKVESTTQTRLKVPPIPSLPPLTTYIPTPTTKYQLPFGNVQSSTPTAFNVRPAQQQQGQLFQQQQQTTQYQRPQQQIQYQQPQPQPYSYPKPQVPVNTQLTSNNQQSSYTIQQRNNIPQTTQKPATQFYQNTTPALPIQRQTPKPSVVQLVPQQVVPQQVVPQQVPQQVVQQIASAPIVDIPTTSVINSDSNPTQPNAGLLASPDIYVVDGRPLKQYKVYEHIDNDIEEEVHNFLPSNFFLNSYHSMIGDTHPLGEDVQVQNRASSFQQRSQLISQPTPNTVALGSGGLGFVKLPNGNVYLGSGSLGYISSLQHSQDVQDLRSRTSSSGPDALHFGHGSLSDSFYYRNQKD